MKIFRFTFTAWVAVMLLMFVEGSTAVAEAASL
jgi:hypothetical protein